jgi:hypothetical protein
VLVVRRVWRPFFAKAPVGEDLRHALLDGTVADDIDNVTNLVLTKVGGQSDHALLLEVAGEGCIAQSALVFANPMSIALLQVRQSSQCFILRLVEPSYPPHSSQRQGVRLTIASSLSETGGVTHCDLCVLAVFGD